MTAKMLTRYTDFQDIYKPEELNSKCYSNRHCEKITREQGKKEPEKYIYSGYYCRFCCGWMWRIVFTLFHPSERQIVKRAKQHNFGWDFT